MMHAVYKGGVRRYTLHPGALSRTFRLGNRGLTQMQHQVSLSFSLPSFKLSYQNMYIAERFNTIKFMGPTKSTSS
jgi:hypothetical protein